MWFEKVETKKGIHYRYSERFRGDDGKERKVSLTFPKKASKKTEREYYDLLYKKFLQRTQKQQDQGPASSVKTFYDLLDTWEELTARNVKYNTARVHNAMVHKIKSLCRDVPLSALTPQLVRQMLDNVYYEKRYSLGYVRLIQCFIKQALTYAHNEKMIQNIDDFLTIKVKKDREREAAKAIAADQNKFLNHDELVEVLRQLHVYNKPVALAMEFIALTGLRVGELLALRTMDYDRSQHTISVNGTLIASKKNGETGQRATPKTTYSIRKVWLNDRAMEILDTTIASYRAYLWKMGVARDSRPPERQYIFCGRNGYPWSHSKIQQALRKVSIPGKNVTAHIFRHTHVSMLIAKGVPIRAVMKRVGHSSPQTTLGIYTHVNDEMAEQEKKAIATFAI